MDSFETDRTLNFLLGFFPFLPLFVSLEPPMSSHTTARGDFIVEAIPKYQGVYRLERRSPSIYKLHMGYRCKRLVATFRKKLTT